MRTVVVVTAALLSPGLAAFEERELTLIEQKTGKGQDAA
jgi:hypothetical protein